MLTGVIAAETVMLNAWVAVWSVELESVTCTVNDAAPACVGVPLIWPVLAPRLRPVGRAPEVMDQWYGPVPPVTDTIAE